MIPIGLPNDQARAAMWQRFIPAAVADEVDVALLVNAPEFALRCEKARLPRITWKPSAKHAG